jgi:serine/threonine-protein kinase
LVDRILAAPAEQRASLIAELAAGDPSRRAELERLVAECERDLPLLNRPAVERFDQLMGEEPALPLPEVLGGRYRIEREVGRGGMARVYLAQDLKHARPVAVKVIRPELAASLGRDRFLREIGIAARLRHPNIMPLYDSGDADGVLYFVMPYEQGLSLRARLEREGGLPISDGVSILRDVARALEYAHQQGVVHRDVKPDNVLLSGNAAVVTDFGIAKAVSAALTEAGGSTITQVGSVIGTPAYMAPEQATGDPGTDHRADIYSFGCMAYEVFTGKPPFTGPSAHQVLAGHLGTAARPVTESRAEVPGNVASLIARCLEKDPAARPQSAKELLNVLGEVGTVERAPIRRRRVPKLLATVLSLTVLAVAAAWYLAPRGGPVPVTVLPLNSIGGDSSQVFLAQGFSDEIATALVKVPWIRVVSRGGAGNYRGQSEIDSPQICNALGAEYLVYGSITNISGRQTILAQLISCETRSVLWADRFDRPSDLAALRDQIVATVGDSLRSHAGSAFRTQFVTSAPTRRGNDASYRLYVLGKERLIRRGRVIDESIALFREAIALDSLYAPAYSGLSMALALSPNFRPVHADSVAQEATTTAQRALQLDPKLAGPHVALGLVLQHSFQWERAESEFKKAIDLDAHEVEARIQYGRHLLYRGRTAAAMEQFRTAQDDDPASAIVASWMSSGWILLGQLDSAVVQGARSVRIDSTTPGGGGTIAALAAGDTAEARRGALRALRYWPLALYALAAIGDTATVRERLRELSAMQPRRWMGETATAYAMLGLGDTARALDAFERATVARETWPFMQATNGFIFDGVRSSPRFQALLRRVGLPVQ